MRSFASTLVLFFGLTGVCHANGTCSVEGAGPASAQLTMKWQSSQPARFLGSYLFNATTNAGEHAIPSFPSGQMTGQLMVALKRVDPKWPSVVLFNAVIDDGQEWTCDLFIAADASQDTPSDSTVFDEEDDRLRAALSQRIGMLKASSNSVACNQIMDRLRQVEKEFMNDRLPGLSTTPEPSLATPSPTVRVRMLQQVMVDLKDLTIARMVALQQHCAVAVNSG